MRGVGTRTVGGLVSIRELGFAFFDFYDLTLVDRRHGVKTLIRSAHFRSFDDFATLAMMIGKRGGVDWSIKGFLPGTKRGRNPS